MGVFRRLGLVLAGTMALAGCGPLSPGQQTQAALEDHLDAEFGDHVIRVDALVDNTLPWSGGLYAAVDLTPDTPPEIFAQVLAELEAFEAANGFYTPVGVTANGVGVCLGDPQREHKQELRDRLFAADTSLRGTWQCSRHGYTDDNPPRYGATLADLLADTELVQDLAADLDLLLLAHIREPLGDVEHAWADLPLAALEAVAAVRQVQQIRSFELSAEGELVIAIAPAADLAAVQGVADAAAGGSATVTVVQGSQDAELQTAFAELAPGMEELRQRPGVRTVEAVSSGYVRVEVEDTGEIQPMLDAAGEQPGLAAATLGLAVAFDDVGEQIYRLPPGLEPTHLDTFVALVEVEDVRQLAVTEMPDGPVRIELAVADPFAQSLAALKPLLPHGADLGARGEGYRVQFVVADQVPTDLPVIGRGEPRPPVAREWNAAP